ncbi:30S ribosomal protein S8 [Candidatus Uhrbacteria bacterium]|nr:30S ribosomal protein S8 [Candidatus Uhrbacteria bacterium]
MITDPISDMLTRIRNAAAARHSQVVLPYSKIKFAIAKILEKEGYLAGVEKINKGFGELKLILRYDGGASAIRGIERVSKPGCRVYAGYDELKSVRSGQGTSIISTSSGLMTGGAARERKLGGEIICKVY